MKNRYTTIRRGLTLTALLTGTAYAAQAQGVGIGTSAPDASAAIDIVSSSKGALLPRVASAAAISNPATGLIVFQTGGTAGYYYNAGTPAAPSWQQLATVSGAAVTASNGLTKTGQDITLGGTLTGLTTIANGGNALNITGAGSTSFGGSVGIGTTAPSQALEVNGGILARGNGAISTQGAYLQWNRSGFEGETWLINQLGNAGAQNYGIRFGNATTNNIVTEWARFDRLGNFSIGVPFTSGQGPGGSKLDVNGSARLRGLTTAGLVTTDADGNLSSASTASFGANFIQNGTAQQTANFNVSGNGTIGGATATATLQVKSNASISTEGGYLQWNRSNFDGETWLLNQKGQSGNGQDGLRFGGVTGANVVTEYARFIGNGSFGIGVAAPTALLDVNGNARLRGLTTAGIVVTDANGNLSSNSGSGSFIQNQTASAQTGGFNVSGAGTVGGNLQANANVAVDGSNANSGTVANTLRFGALNSGEAIGSKRTTNGNQYGLDFYTNSTARLSISYTGSVGIGTTTPALNLDVVGTALGLRNNSAWDHLYFTHDGVTATMRAGGAENGLALQVSGGGTGSYGDASQTYRDVLRLLPNGNVGVGTTTPRAPLEVSGIALVGGNTLPNTSNVTGIGWNAVKSGFGETEFYNYRGLGQGGFRFFSIGNTGTPSTSNQVAFIDAAGNYSALSDRRVKTNIVGLQQGLRTVLALRPVSYDFHTSRQFNNGVVTFLPDDKPVKALGFIAQELYQVLPEAVEKPQDERTGLYTVSYSTLVPVLTQAIQEQQAQIEALKAQNAALTAKAAALESRAAQADADHASLQTLQQQVARLLGETAPPTAQAHK